MYVMKFYSWLCLVYSCYLCNLVPIHSCSLSCLLITLILVRHPTFYKIIQLSSHMLLSVKFVLINPCIPLGGAPYMNLENKTLVCSIVEKL
jgi:hypothetical protein